MAGGWEIAEVGEGGVEVEEFDEGVGALGGFVCRGRNDEGNVGVEFEGGRLVEEAVLADVEAVIGPEDNEGVVAKFEGVEFVEDAADLGVEVADGSEVAVVFFAEGGAVFEPSKRARVSAMSGTLEGGVMLSGRGIFSRS